MGVEINSLDCPQITKLVFAVFSHIDILFRVLSFIPIALENEEIKKLN